MAKGVASKTVLLILQERASEPRNAAKRVYFTRKKKQWRENTEQLETKMVMHASGVGRKGSTEYRMRKKARQARRRSCVCISCGDGDEREGLIEELG